LNPFFDLIDALSQELPLQPDTVSRLTKHTLVLANTSRNPYFNKYETSSKEDLSRCLKVELRAPTEKSDRGGLVILTFIKNRLTLTEASAKWGKSTWTGPPPPEDVDRPEYYEFIMPWGALRLGFSPATKMLVVAVLDAASQPLPR
jgi:hypothetical protein